MKFKWLQLDSNPEPLSSQTNTQSFGQTDHLDNTQSFGQFGQTVECSFTN